MITIEQINAAAKHCSEPPPLWHEALERAIGASGWTPEGDLSPERFSQVVTHFEDELSHECVDFWLQYIGARLLSRQATTAQMKLFVILANVTNVRLHDYCKKHH